MNAGIKAVTLCWPVAKYVITPIRIRAAPNATVNRAIGSLLHFRTHYNGNINPTHPRMEEKK
jgi:hypothetical protein